MLSRNRMAALAMFGAAAVSSQAVLIGYWNFNTLTGGPPPSNANQTAYAPDTGSGMLNLAMITSNNTAEPYGINNFSGTTTNAIGADPAGRALAIQGGSAGSTGTVNNGAMLVFTFNLTGYMNPILTFATQKTSTGFNNNQVAYSTDGVNYTNFGSAYNPVTSFANPNGLQTFDFSTENTLDNNASVYIKITLNGATGTSGNNRFDNIQMNATVVPEPASLAALGLGAAALWRRRRNAR